MAEIFDISVFEKIYAENGPKRFQMQAEYKEKARAAGCAREYNAAYADYQKQIKESTIHTVSRSTNFEGQNLKLDTGDWQADDDGITATIDGSEVCACHHAIMPVEILIDADSGNVSIQIAYKRAGNAAWEYGIYERAVLSDTRKIVQALASAGIDVTSETAKYLVRYFQDVLRLNNLPEFKTSSRLGWVHKKFIPYTDDSIQYGGDIAFRSTFEAVGECGSFDEWKRTVSNARLGSVVVRAVLNASFASSLLEPLGKLPFFLHIWGPSGTGKTVALMLAASIYGNTDPGKLVKSFNGTNTGLERHAAFFNSIPLLLDELQTRNERQRREQDIIYMLSSGQGKPRGTRNGGIERLPTWRNCIITTGEQPLTEDGASAGAINRVINLYQGKSVFKDAPSIANTIRANYGHAGRMFVEAIMKPNVKSILPGLYDKLYRHVLTFGPTEKQAMAAAMLALGEYYADLCIFGMDEECSLAMAQTFSEAISKHLVSNSDVDDTAKAYDWLCGWVAANKAKFDTSSVWGECYGIPDGNGGYYINNQVLQKALMDAGMSCRKALQGLADKKMIETRSERGNTVFSVKRTIGELRPRCVHLLGSNTSNPLD